ncbi:MAG: precorrin-2 C(20)-methyltransferase [Clostridiales bacterium]|nr:precorrin-2 C(20)-methyltransferase [Clostridiales bacterium]
MRGKVFCIGVGPGDPELMTLKAVRLIKEKDIILLPGKEPKETVAYRIAVQSVPELKDKELVAIDMPMTKDQEVLKEAHRKGAELIESYLDQGRDACFLTIGDPTIYCTFTYLQTILNEDGYETEFINGITSFCAAAARLNIPIAEWEEPIHILPAAHNLGNELEYEGNYVIMKTGSHMGEVKEMIRNSGREARMVMNCGMKDERVYSSTDEIPDDSGYFSLIIAK